MNLPINQAALYSVVIPSTGKKIRFRQFLVREQKALLIAQQSNDEEVMYNTLKEVISNCIKDPVDIESLALFDIEYLFINIRSKSVGETVDIIIKCPDCNDDKASIQVTVNLEDVKIKRNEDHTNKIHLFDDVGVVMNYPSFNTLHIIKKSNMKDPNEAIKIIIDCMDYIYNTNEIFKIKDVPEEKLIEFIDNLTDTQLNHIKSFFKSMPLVYIDVNYQCPMCNKVHQKRLEGLVSFF